MRVVGHRDFFLLWTAQVFSQASTRMYQIALIWWILSQGFPNQGTLLSVFLLVGALPAILLVKPIGQIIDRNLSRNVLSFSDLTAAVVASLVALAFHWNLFSLWIILASDFLIALSQAFIDPTLNKAVLELLEEEHVEDGVSFIASTQPIANFAGATLGAIFLDQIGIMGVMVVNAASFFISAICVRLIQFKFAKPIPQRTKSESQPEAIPSAPTRKAESGWAFVKQNPLLGATLVGFALVNFFGVPTLVVLPLYVKEVLHGSASMLGLAEACLWSGLIAGSWSARFFGSRANILRLGALCLALFGLPFIVVGLWAQPSVYLVALFLAGSSLGVNNVKFSTLFQLIVPGPIKGSFFALMQSLISLCYPIGYLLFGFLSTTLPATKLSIIQGVGILLLSLGFLALSPRSHEFQSSTAQEVT